MKVSLRVFHDKYFSSCKVKTIEKAQFTNVNEHFEIVFNAAGGKGNS